MAPKKATTPAEPVDVTGGTDSGPGLLLEPLSALLENLTDRVLNKHEGADHDERTRELHDRFRRAVDVVLGVDDTDEDDAGE